MAASLALGLSAVARPVDAACGTYVLVAGQVVVHEMLPYQPQWRVLNEPQMKQLLNHRWSIDFAVVPPCDDCSCDGRPPSDTLPPVTMPVSRDLSPATQWSGTAALILPEPSRPLSPCLAGQLLPGHPFPIERPPEGWSFQLA